MNILITGGAGFVCSHLADTLFEKQHDLILLDNLLTGNKNNVEHLLDHKNVKFMGFINKNDPKGEKMISENLIKNHFHLLLSKSEAYGLALIEANSRGVPNVTFNVGGISQIIKNNINGKTFNKNESLNKIANYIIKKSINKKSYNELALSSYKEYKYIYSYDKIIKKFIKLIYN